MPLDDTGASDDIFTRNKAWAKPAESYLTSLPPEQEKSFQDWVKANGVPFDAAPTADYDMRGYWEALQAGDPRAKTATDANDQKLHYPDYWKTPYHKSFSNESRWATEDAPRWNDKDQLVGKDGTVIFDDRAQAAKQGAAKPWSAVANSPAYQQLPPDQQAAARRQYFESVVAPQVPEDQRAAAQAQFENEATSTPGLRAARTHLVQADAALGPDAPGRARGRSFLYGATLGWEPEIIADLHYGLVDKPAELIQRGLGGKPAYTAEEARTAMKEHERAGEAANIEENPVSGRAEEFAGGFMAPGVGKAAEWVSGGSSMLGRAGRAALAAIPYGVVGGASQEGSRLAGALEGGAIAAVTGGAVSPVGEVVARGLPTVAKHFGAGMSEAWDLPGGPRLCRADSPNRRQDHRRHPQQPGGGGRQARDRRRGAGPHRGLADDRAGPPPGHHAGCAGKHPAAAPAGRPRAHPRRS